MNRVSSACCRSATWYARWSRNSSAPLPISSSTSTAERDRRAAFPRAAPLFAPEGRREQHREGDDLDAAKKHRCNTGPVLEVVQRAVIAARSDDVQSGTDIVDAGDDGRERGNKVQARDQQREYQHHDGDEK